MTSFLGDRKVFPNTFERKEAMICGNVLEASLIVCASIPLLEQIPPYLKPPPTALQSVSQSVDADPALHQTPLSKQYSMCSKVSGQGAEF